MMCPVIVGQFYITKSNWSCCEFTKTSTIKKGNLLFAIKVECVHGSITITWITNTGEIVVDLWHVSLGESKAWFASFLEKFA